MPIIAFAAASVESGSRVGVVASTSMPVPTDVDLGLTASVEHRRVVLRWRGGRPLGGAVFYRISRDRSAAPACAGSSGAPTCTVTLTEVGVSRSPEFVDRPQPGRWFYRVAIAANWLNDPGYGDRYLVAAPSPSTSREPSGTATAVPTRVTARLALGAGVVTAVATAAAVAAARHASPSEVSPVVPAHGWNAVWIGGTGAALCLYAVGWLLARRQPLRLGAVVAVAVVVQALPLAAPLLLSKDAYTYWAQARVAVVHHANPYVTAPSAFPRDPALPYVSQSWLDSHAVYGPAWEAVGTLPALAAG